MSYNGDNVPDDMRYSDYWDDKEVLCPRCHTEMDLIDDSRDLECSNCEYVLFGDDGEPDNGEW